VIATRQRRHDLRKYAEERNIMNKTAKIDSPVVAAMRATGGWTIEDMA